MYNQLFWLSAVRYQGIVAGTAPPRHHPPGEQRFFTVGYGPSGPSIARIAASFCSPWGA